MSRFIKRAASAKPLILPSRASMLRPASALQGGVHRSLATSAAAAVTPMASMLKPASVSATFSASNAALLRSWPQTQITTLPNGLRIASEAGEGETATVGVWIDTGSRYENDNNNGVAHFLEHMSFKGTHRRTRLQLETEVENIGGHLNAYTSRESTVYYAKVFKRDVGQALDILSDILTNSRIDADDIERERDTILREMKEVDGQLEEVIFDRLHQTAFRGTALARTILGSAENVQRISRQDITDYIATHYTAPRMVIAGAGAVDHKQLVDLSTKLFAKVPSAPTNGVQPFMEPARFTGSDILVRYDDMPTAYVAYGFATGGWKDPDNFALMLIQTLLGSWDKNVHGGVHSSSAMISNIAKFDLAHSVSSFNTQYSDTGLFGIYAQADPTSLHNLTFSMTAAMRALSYAVSEAQLDEAKNQLRMNMLGHLDGSTVIAEDIGRQILSYGRRMHPVEVMQRIDAVDVEQIMATARRYFQDRDHALAAIGPIWELPDYNWIRSSSFSRLI